jgi:hypothetical protein
MSFKNPNMIVLIFIIVLLLALYIFTKNPTNRVIVNNSSTIIKDTFKGNRTNTTTNATTNATATTTNATATTTNAATTAARSSDSNSTNGSNTNNKIKIKNRDNSLLQQFIKSDNTSNNSRQKEQNAKEFQKMLKDDLEKNVAGVYNTLKNISSSASIPTANTLINNDKYKGYNNYVSLRTDSYAPVTSIGKQLITPYASYPVAC